MFRKALVFIVPLTLALGLAIFHPEPTAGQGNPTCPTRPTGDNSNACASTAFVNQAFATSPTVISFNGRTGVVIPATNDYSFSQLSGNTLISQLPSDNTIWRTATSTDTILNTDCWKTIEEGTGLSGFFSVTLPSVSGFPAGCRVWIKNGDTGRAKGLTGFPADVSAMLWPLQTVGVQIVNGAWVTIYNPGRWISNSAVTINVDPVNGNDANDGLATGTGNALATFNQAMTNIATQMVNNGGVTILSAASASYTNVPFTSQIYNGSGCVTVDGNSSTHTISSGFGNLTFSVQAGCWFLRRFTLANSVSTGQMLIIQDSNQVKVEDGMVYGGTTNGIQISCVRSTCTFLNNFTVTGGGNIMLSMTDWGKLNIATVTINCNSGSYAFGTSTMYAHGAGATIEAGGITWSNCGSVTGSSGNANLLGLIDAAGTCNNAAGNSNCTASSGGIVN